MLLDQLDALALRHDSKQSQTLSAVAKTSGCGVAASRGLYYTCTRCCSKGFFCATSTVKPHQQPLFNDGK